MPHQCWQILLFLKENNFKSNIKSKGTLSRVPFYFPYHIFKEFIMRTLVKELKEKVGQTVTLYLTLDVLRDQKTFAVYSWA